MALTGVKLDSDAGNFVSNCFPVRGLVKRDVNEGDGAWFVAHKAEQRRRFKAVLCAKPRTYSRIREERKRAEEQGIRMTASQIEGEDEKEPEGPVLDGYFLLKHCCVEDPVDLCSVNIAGQELSDVKEDDFDIFDNVAYINAGENFLPFEAFRGFPSLRELEMPMNGLRSLKLQNNDFLHLEVFDVSYNNLSHADVLTLGQLPGLRVLHLTGNNFRDLPQDMSLPYISPDRKVRRPRFCKLEVLLLDDNRLSDINVFAALAGLPKLRHINMEKNQVYCIPQLKCVEGRVVTHEGSKPSGRTSARRSRSRISGSPGLRPRSAGNVITKETTELTGVGATSEDVTDVGGQATVGVVPSDTDVAHTTSPEPPKSAAKQETATQDDLELEELMNEEFSLGELGERITELEQEATKDTSMEKEFTAKAFPPFPELRYLNLAHNEIQEEDALLAVAAWPMLVHLVIHSNPLTTQHGGDPPLLKRFLSDRLGIRLQRKDEPRLTKPKIEINSNKERMVSDLVPKVPRSTIEERIQQLALEAPLMAPPPAPETMPSRPLLLDDRTLSGLDLETSKRMPLPPITPVTPAATPQMTRPQAWTDKAAEKAEKTEPEPEPRPDSGAFFMTQVDDQAAEEMAAAGKDKKKSKRQIKHRTAGEKLTNTNNSSIDRDDRYRGYELLVDVDSDVEMEVELPKDIQGNVRALKHALGHTLVYRDAAVDLDRVKRTVPEFRRAPVPPPQPHKSRQEQVDVLLEDMRTRNTLDEESLTRVLKGSRNLHRKFPDAQHLLAQIQRRYNTVRVSSMKEAAEARKIIDQAFEVLNKPKQTYTPSV